MSREKETGVWNGPREEMKKKEEVGRGQRKPRSVIMEWWRKFSKIGIRKLGEKRYMWTER